MNITYLIAAHTDPKQLNRLVNALDERDNLFFIHIDKKQDIQPFLDIKKNRDNIHFINNRIADYWSGFSHLKALDALLKEALKFECDRLVYVSGLDYPVWSNERMAKWYDENKEKQVVCAYNLTKCGDPLPQGKISHLAWWDVPIKNEKLFNKVRRKLNDFLMHFKHPLSFYVDGKEWDVFWGSDWWSLSYDAAKYVYDTYHEHREIEKYFRWCFCPSELWVQTILANSEKYRNNIDYTTNFSLEAVTPLQLIDYKASMYIWKEKDFDKIVKSGKMFIRKTTSKESEELQDKIDKERS